jgi:cytochrome b
MKPPTTTRVRIWDLPTRVFHWSLAACVIGLLVTGKIAGDDIMVWHARLGYCVGTLLLFRLTWGFAGGRWSRFASFAPSAARAWRHLRSRDEADPVGHSPLGAWSVYAMLVFLVAQVATGLFSQTKEDFAGPLSALVSNAAAHVLTGYHKNIGQAVLIALVSLHLAAIGYYAWRGRRLLAPMLSGDAPVMPGTPASRDDARTRALAVILLSLCSLAMWGLVKLGG